MALLIFGEHILSIPAIASLFSEIIRLSLVLLLF
ncbi:hypothetical protein MAMMFC1_01586 [Methylomusa anaerophila]|uniref:Uncharacterized protein n=1 Tax=Methylomusa anaerophila TaxID=1930071 RepID=A0A348AIM1_9FIRM|nr:hypothetical protein MAMMFC1_01586 [Methylomusa anaerophila]